MPTLLPSLGEALTTPIYEQQTRLSEQELEALKSTLTLCTYQAGDPIFQYQAQADAIYFVISGKVLSYEKLAHGKIMAFDRSPRCGFFGEVATFYGGHRTAAACALERTELLKLDLKDLDKFIKQHPHLARLVMKGMAERLSRSGKDLTDAPYRDPGLTEARKPTVKDRVILAAGNFLGGSGFLLLFFVLMCAWGVAHSWRHFDPNVIWIALTLSVVQIIISNLVLKSQLHAARLDEELKRKEREANLIGGQEIHNLHPKLDEHMLELSSRLDEIVKRLDKGKP